MKVSPDTSRKKQIPSSTCDAPVTYKKNRDLRIARRRPLTTTDGGANGKNPRAISSAMRKRISLSSRVSISLAKAALPAPFLACAIGPMI